ncbi:hypothetical protein MHYP_G00088460 [Metynnis hypsauchen]
MILIDAVSDRLTKEMEWTSGICRYGNTVDCCWGWTRESWGQCRPVCELGCKHGECVGPDQCRCHRGYTGKTCNQDLNECGLKPRPCKHRCMNMVGSYKCYCLNGYMMMRDGTCRNARTCAMVNCQYGCAVMLGEVTCQCPSPGLRLGPDRRTCVDIDECVTGEARCPRFRKCVNTFGSYICKCHKGFELRYINGKYQCTDKNDPFCHDKLSSKKCKCKPVTHSRDCRPLIKVMPTTTIPTTPVPTTPTRKHTTTTSTTVTMATTTTTTTAVIPTTPPAPPTQAAPSTNPVITTTLDNRIQNELTQRPRGDVHIPRNRGENSVFDLDFDIELGNTAEYARDDPGAGSLSCSFDQGICRWMTDQEGDVRWETVSDPAGGRYLTIPDGTTRSFRGARLTIPLAPPKSPPWHAGDLCLSFRHRLHGHHIGSLQVFVRKGRSHSPAIWTRTGGQGWRHTQITLWGRGLESVVLKGERRRGRSGEIAVDDFSLRRGACSDTSRK